MCWHCFKNTHTVSIRVEWNISGSRSFPYSGTISSCSILGIRGNSSWNTNILLIYSEKVGYHSVGVFSEPSSFVARALAYLSTTVMIQSMKNHSDDSINEENQNVDSNLPQSKTCCCTGPCNWKSGRRCQQCLVFL